MLCEKCGSEMEHFIEGSSQGARCPHCGWDVVTTYIPPIRSDPTVYRVFVSGKGFQPSVDQLRAVSRLMTENYMRARNLLLGGDEFCVCEGNAVRVQEVARILDSVHVGYRIEPDYPYMTGDESSG